MPKSYEDVIDDTLKPRWIGDCEPVEGTPDAEETVNINETTGNLTLGVDGVSNRPVQDNYGIAKLLALLASDHHYDDGMHHIRDIDVAEGAGIKESLAKLNLDFYGMDIPEEDVSSGYTSTTEIAEKIEELFRIIAILRKGLGSHIATRLNIKYMSENELGLVGFIDDPNYFTDISAVDRTNFEVLKNNSKAWINGKRLNLQGTNIAVDEGSCHIELSNLQRTGFSDIEADIIWLEIYTNILTDSYVPYGNLQYGSLDSYLSIIPTNTAEWVDIISPGDHNITLIADEDPDTLPFIIQFQYKFGTDIYDPSSSFYGIDAVQTTNGKSIVRSDIRGLWKASDSSCLVLPIALLSKKNLGIYHKALNPAGTSILRTGSSVPSSLIECFEYDRIGYFDSVGDECDYNLYEYNTIEDIYTDSSGDSLFERSGLASTLQTSNPDGKYADKIYTNDIAYVGKQATDDLDMIVDNISERLLGTDLYTELGLVYSGLASDATFTKGLACGKRPMQTIGFGLTEDALFGLDNNGGIFINETNNSTVSNPVTGIIDTVRTYWADPKKLIEYGFTLTEGDGDSESQTFLSYNPASQILSINSTGLSGSPTISALTPSMHWADGSAVVLETNWSGLETTTADCKIQVTGHLTHKLYGQVLFEYSEGSGTPFRLDDIIEIEDMKGTSYPFCYEKYENCCLGCIWTGNPAGPDDGSKNYIILPECIECDSEEELVGAWIYILDNSIENGEYRQITSYDDTLRRVDFSPNFDSVITPVDTISIGKLKPEVSTFIIVPYGRGIKGVFQRKRVKANAVGIVTNELPIIFASSGTISSTLMTGLTANTWIEIITREVIPVAVEPSVGVGAGFYITFYHNPQFAQLKSISDITEMTVKRPGIFVDTINGSANVPYDLYRGFVPAASVRIVDDTKWISTDCNDPYFTINNLDYNRTYDIRPIENLKLVVSGFEIRTNVVQLGDYLKVVTNITETNDNYRLLMGTILVDTDKGFKLLVCLINKGTFGFDLLTNCFLVNCDGIW